MFCQSARCISDLHLCLKDNRDDFYSHPQLKLFLEFLNDCCRNNITLFILGDFLEMWQASFDDITATYSEVFELLRQVSTVVIVGNHDEGLLKIAAALHFEVLPSLKLVNTYLHHGHVFDPVNSSKWMWVGREATKIAGWIEKLGYKDIDKDYDKLKERIRPRDPKSEVDYVEANAKLAVLLGVKTMIFGHTHEALDKYYQLPGREPIHILNCGTWVDGKRDYIEFDYEAKTFNLLVWKERSGTN